MRNTRPKNHTTTVAAASAVKYLTENKFIDNARFADAFAADKFRFAKWGAHKIAAALRHKHIDEHHINTALSHVAGPEREKQMAVDEMAKKLRGFDRNEPKQIIWQKLMRFGMAKGYRAETCKEAISRLFAEL